MILSIDEQGDMTCLYSELIDLEALGARTIRRASQVEPTATGEWTADMSPVAGPVLGPFKTRTEALAAEVLWLENRIGKSTTFADQPMKTGAEMERDAWESACYDALPPIDL